MARLKIRKQADRIAEAWKALRAERDRRLAETDWTQLPDVSLSPEERAAWQAYRQALRDLPAIVGEEDLLAGRIPWPEPPVS